MKFPAPAPRYVGPAKFHGDADNKPIHRIVMHSTVGPTRRGSASGVAAYFRDRVTRPSSAHYVVDAGSTLQVVHDSVVAYHAPPNTHSLGVEMCDYPSTVDSTRWDGADHREMLERAAQLVAELCLAYDVPPYYRSARALRRGARGVTTHRQVSLAFGQTDHWDPGSWPRLRFMHRVRALRRALIKAAAK